ncbi:MAG TPA: hypothetical protein DEB15_09015 [Pusillimonas sp.]|jgi:hypothetical protein|nr:hypothetical protein [Pusillimonas sp.]|tara:strand:+ start:35321 stop:35947 length:627 start_codon:yes stop_codon:yes gene_type:complete
MAIKKSFWVAASALILSGCAGSAVYQQPETYQPGSNEKVIDRPLDDVWASSVPALGKQFFDINNIDRSSGLINISYSGNPEEYIDCGRIDSQVFNLRGKRHYNFAASSPSVRYEIMERGNLFIVDRKQSLNGRINLIFEAINKKETRVTANTKYVLNRLINIIPIAAGSPRTVTDSITFNSNSGAAFTQGTRCVSTGKLEKEVLSMIQ